MPVTAELACLWRPAGPTSACVSTPNGPRSHKALHATGRCRNSPVANHCHPAAGAEVRTREGQEGGGRRQGSSSGCPGQGSLPPTPPARGLAGGGAWQEAGLAAASQVHFPGSTAQVRMETEVEWLAVVLPEVCLGAWAQAGVGSTQRLQGWSRPPPRPHLPPTARWLSRPERLCAFSACAPQTRRHRPCARGTEPRL